jgi:hypothetical protein
MHSLAAQPSLPPSSSYIASSIASVADLLNSHVGPLHAADELMFKSKNAAALLRCSVMGRDVQKSFNIAAELSSIASTPGASPSVVLHCAKALSCLVGAHPKEARAVQLLHELSSYPQLKGDSPVRACALEILSSRTVLESADLLPLQQRILKIQAACTLCVAKQYPLQLLASEMQAVLAQENWSSVRLQVSCCSFSVACSLQN